MKIIKLMLLSLLIASCQGEDISKIKNTKSIKEHYSSNKKNEFTDYLVKVKTVKFFADYSELYVVSGGLANRGGAVPVLLERKPAFADQVSAQRMRGKKNRRMMGLRSKSQNVMMYLLVKPAGIKSYIHPGDQSNDSSVYFEPVKVCSIGWKKCDLIK